MSPNTLKFHVRQIDYRLMMVEIPTIETARLRLRAHRQQDLESCAALWSDPDVTKYIGGRPFSREEVWARMLRYRGHWSWLGFGFWLIEERATGSFVGEAGLADFKRDITPAMPPGPEAGWVLATQARGKGFATEALRAIVGWHEKQIQAQPVTCLIHPQNAASIRVAVKCGFEVAFRATYNGQMTTVYLRR